MPMTEIDETELLNHKRLSQFVNQGLNNPKTRRKLLEVQKALNPDTVIPELDAAEPIQAELGEIRKLIEDDRAERAKDREEGESRRSREALERKWMAGRASLRDQGYTDEGIAAVEKLMEDHGVADHDVARSHYERLNPPAAPVEAGSGRWDFFSAQTTEAPDLKELIQSQGTSETWLDQAVASTFKEVRGR